MRKCLGGGMMVEISDGTARFKNSFDLGVIGVQRHVEYGDVNRFLGGDSPQQVHLALDAGNQDRILRLRQPELMQRTQAVRVAIENIVCGAAGDRSTRSR